MNTEKATEIILKCLSNQANFSEMEELTVWLQDLDNQKIFDDLVKVDSAAVKSLQHFDKDKIKMQLLSKINENEKSKSVFRMSNYMKMAAILVIALGSWFLYQNNTSVIDSNEVFASKSEVITLEMEDGSIQELDLSTRTTITNAAGKILGSSSSNGLVYNATNAVNQKISYNTLKIPFGKKLQLQLSDGTKVFLNSGTTLRFPTAFSKQGNRSVFLSGEAYFDVTKDKKHPFKVNTDAVDVEVLGTKFNVNSYGDEVVTNVVLVEGKVALTANNAIKNETVDLTPGYKGSILNGSTVITTEKVNTKVYTAWMSGTLVFKNAKFENIVKTLERTYNVTIVVKNKALNAEIFNATFSNESIESLLKHLGESYPIKYTIKNNIIYIE